MDAGRVGGRLIEEFDGAGESEIRIVGAQSGKWGQTGVPLDADAFFDEDRRGARGTQQGEVAAISEEGDLARDRVVHAGDAGDFVEGIAFESAGKFFSEGGEFHCERLLAKCGRKGR